MTTYYVDAVDGNNVNLGTSAGSGNAWQTIDKAMNSVAAGDKVWVKASGNYNEIATIDTVGTRGSEIVFEGYTTTTGDGGQAVIDGQSTRANGIASSLGNASYYYCFKNLRVTACTGDGFSFGALNGDHITCKNCTSDNNSGKGFVGDNDCLFERCSSNNNTIGFDVDVRGIYVSCESYANSGNGFVATGGVAYGCLAYANGAKDYYMISSTNLLSAVFNCTSDGEGDASHICYDFSNAWNVTIVNCIVHDGDTGIDGGTESGEMNIALGNLYNSNTNDFVSFTTEDVNKVSGVPSFTDEANDDYTLQSSSLAKAAGTDAGSVVSGATSYMDIGAHQRQEPAGGGGGGMVVHPGMAGGMRG